MLKSLFRQIKNQYHANAWVWTELVIVITLLWYGIDLIYNYEAVARQPKGYDTECVYNISLNIQPAMQSDSVVMSHSAEYLDQIYQLISHYQGVEETCYYYGSIPYTDQTMHEGYAPHADSTHWVNCFIRYVSPTYFKVFRLEPIDGSFDAAKWKETEYPMPVLMSANLSDSLFSRREAVGKTCFNPYFLKSEHPQTNYQVMAVLSPHKLNDYERYEPFIYLPAPQSLERWFQIAVRVTPDQAAGFAERFTLDMQKKLSIGPYYLYDISSYAGMKEAYDLEKGTVNYLNTAYAVIAFFVFNIFLGMLGTFWFRTHKRRGEIALRMALGSSRKALFGYYMAEGILLLALAAIPALVICIQIQMTDLTVHTLTDPSIGRFIFCFAAALLLLAIIIALGILFPARKAMKIQPAEALHDE